MVSSKAEGIGQKGKACQSCQSSLNWPESIQGISFACDYRTELLISSAVNNIVSKNNSVQT